MKAPNEVLKALREADRIAIMSHSAPDGDALGSILALSAALRKLGKQAVALANDPPPALYSYLPELDRLILPGDALPFTPELCVAVDISDLPRLGEWASLFQDAPATLCIDHHESKNPIGDIHWVDPSLSAACEMTQAVIRGLDIDLDLPIAQYLYTGISTDTGNFGYSNTTPSALRAVAELVDAGVDVAEMTRLLYRSRSFARVKILGRAIDSLVIDDGIATMRLTRRDFDDWGALDSDAEGVVNYAIEMEGVSVAVLAKEHVGGTKLSLRSLGGVNVAEISASLGGGGHERAAGVTLADNIDDALAKVLAAIRREKP